MKSTVHPRACGERLPRPWLLLSGGGSSPRLRGTRPITKSRQVVTRFIPAPAGNARAFWSRVRSLPVHPRACGERSPSTPPIRPRRGSSPRLRGTRHPQGAGAASGRFIPAPAGNAHAQRQADAEGPVHPRACGERWKLQPLPAMTGGSSPRLRGTPVGRLGLDVEVRFIPAPAGNALAFAIAVMISAVHPRACGERHDLPIWKRLLFGSSPRLRGTPPHAQPCPALPRFIPAPAGNALLRVLKKCWPSVHPRACGER